MSKYMDIFRSESEKNINEMSDSLLALEKDPANTEQMNRMFRVAHTFKGMAATMGFRQIVELTHEMESLIDSFRSGRIILDSSLIDFLFKCLDLLEDLVGNVCVGVENNTAESKQNENNKSCSDADKPYSDTEKLLNTLRAINSSPEENILQKNETDASSTDKNVEKKEEKVEDRKETEGIKEAKNREEETEERKKEKAEERKEEPEKREKEKELEKLESTGEELEEKNGFNLPEISFKDNDIQTSGMQNLKIKDLEINESKIQDSKIRDLETYDSPRNDLKTQYIKIKCSEMQNSKILDSKIQDSKIQDSKIQDSKIQDSKILDSKIKRSKIQSPKIQSSRVSTEQMDKLMNLVGELVINRSRVKELSGESRSKDLEIALSDFQKLTRELQEEVLEIRMIPLDHITNIFPRMIRDVARAQNKKINFIIKGKEIKLDRAIMEEIGDPLVHLLRNAVDHGIENPDKRVELGKEETGSVMITASRQQNYVLIKIEDDGRGISAEEIRKAALEKGLISREEAENLSEREAIQLIFTPGLSTASVITDLSGRGVGMDIVKNRIERLGGSVRVESNFGSGSRFELKLPITVALYQAMLVKVETERYAIPFTNVVKSISVRKEDVRHIRGEEVVIINEKALPLLRLRKLFQLPAAQKEESLVVVIVEKAGQYIGLIVDALLGKQEVIIKNFKSRLLERTRGFAGATIMGDGSVILILDINSIT